jgi:hypothetical protein
LGQKTKANSLSVAVASDQVLSIGVADGPNNDAFSRLRTSAPARVFDCSFQYTLRPLLFEAVTAESGATITHDTTNKAATFTFSSTPTGGKAFHQSYDFFRYQAGRSHLVIIAFNFIGTATNVTKFAGYCDGSNGIRLELLSTGAQLTLYSTTDNGNQTVTQANWNIDKMAGAGPSGITVDWTKAQIFVVDLQWLSLGRVRCYLDIDGILYPIHQFVHANLVAVAYMQTANLPIQVGMTCAGTATTTMRFMCTSVASEGGQNENELDGYDFSVEGTVTASSGARTHILSVRPKTTFNSIANRTKFALQSVEILVTGNNPIQWELCIGQAISGTTTFNDVNATYSAFEFNTAGTISGSPAIVMRSGYVPSSSQTKGVGKGEISYKYPITLNAAGVVRANGTITLLVTGIGGSSACRAIMNWKEIR